MENKIMAKQRNNDRMTARNPVENKVLREFQAVFVEEYVAKSHKLPRPDLCAYSTEYESFVEGFVNKRATLRVENMRDAFRHGVSILQSARKSGKLTVRCADMTKKADLAKAKTKKKNTKPAATQTSKKSEPTPAEIEAAKLKIRNERKMATPSNLDDLANQVAGKAKRRA